MFVVIFDEVAFGSGLWDVGLWKMGRMLVGGACKLCSVSFLLLGMIERWVLMIEIRIIYVSWAGVSGIHKLIIC